jgi:hypothetical protein
MFMNFEEIEQRIADAANEYEKKAPTVRTYLEDLCERMNSLDKVRLSEIRFLESLCEEGLWMQPNYAANCLYKLMDRIGMSTVGHLGF